MKEENIEINANILNVILQYCNGDMRKILNYIQLFKFHKCQNNTDDYFSLLRIPNLEYIEVFYKKLIKKDEKMFNYFENGLKLGYYDVETFCQSLYKILIKNYDDIDEKIFIKLVDVLTQIDKTPDKIKNYRAFIDNLYYCFI
jgi:DNA polymerase III delta prime subunit